MSIRGRPQPKPKPWAARTLSDNTHGPAHETLPLLFLEFRPKIRRNGGSRMILSTAVHNRLLPLAALLLCSTSALSQAPPKYDATTETTVKVTVTELKLVPPTGGKPVAYLVTKSGPDKDKDAVHIFLCPKSFLDQMGIAFKADEPIEVKGSKVKQDGTDLILAREMVKGGETLTFRFPDGKPAW